MSEPVDPSSGASAEPDEAVLDAAAAAIVTLLQRPLTAEEEAGLMRTLAATPALHAEVAVADLLLQARAERQIEDGADAAWAHLQALLRARTAAARPDEGWRQRLGAFWARWPLGTALVLATLLALVVILGLAWMTRAG